MHSQNRHMKNKKSTHDKQKQAFGVSWKPNFCLRYFLKSYCSIINPSVLHNTGDSIQIRTKQKYGL